MSSYLLLRNNKESGPFTIEEIKGMSLKPYDLLWVVGKSAAWRYPGEINELKSFAPPVPEQITDSYINNQNADSAAAVSSNIKKSNPINVSIWETNVQKGVKERSVYVNLPSEKKLVTIQQDRVLFDLESPAPLKHEPAYDFSDQYNNNKSTPAVYFSAKILWISTIILLFGAGLLTGFFISDRRKFFSTDANHPQNRLVQTPMVLDNKKNITSENTINNPKNEKPIGGSSAITDQVKPDEAVLKKQAGNTLKKNTKNIVFKKDSLINQTPVQSSLKSSDSLKQIVAGQSDMIYQKIKANPENYVNLVTGRYSTGVFGGISSFPVTVTNTSTVMMEEVMVDINYIQTNGKTFKTENLSFNDLEPGETVTLKAPKSSRGVKITTHIHLVNFRKSDFSTSN